MKKYISYKLIAIIIIALFLGFFDLPDNAQKALMPFTPESITKAKINLGLDLQGGSQLDYKIDLRTVPEKDQKQIIEGVTQVIEKRVNGLGIAEPNIYNSNISGEAHIIVELAENSTITQEDVTTYLGKDKILADLNDDEKKEVSLEKAKATVGKTIQLEFKEEKQGLDPEEKDKVKILAQDALNKIKKGQTFEIVAQEEIQAYPGKVKYNKPEDTFKSDIPSYLKDKLSSMNVGDYYGLIETGGSFVVNESGQTIEDSGFGIVKLLDIKEEIKSEKEIDASHILISYKDAQSADAAVTITKDEAYTKAKEVKEKLTNGEDFATLAQTYSDDKSNKDKGGRLDNPVSGDGSYVYDFEKTALELKEKGQISDIIHTQFGYHIIKANDIKENVKEPKYKYELLVYSTIPDPWQETGLTGKQFTRADVQLDQFYQPYVTIQFNEEGAKLFEEITGRNVNKRVAIFVGGTLISAPKVNEKIAGGSAQISGQFTNEEAQGLARDLNTGAIPAPIVLTGEYTIGASLGKDALNKSLFAGVIGLLAIMILMVYKYRWAGLMADIALAIYAIILLFLIKSQLHIGFALLASLLVFGFLTYKIIENKDSSWEKFLSFSLSCVGFFFLTYLLKTGVVITLAGITGILLSLGMAVDANVLIFERMKEEMKDGKTYGAALEAGFARAWSAIRDSNFSTLITCAILFYFGSSIIRGFAFNLAAGILVSMFTAIVVTKGLMEGFVGKELSKNERNFGLFKEKKEPAYKFIQNSKIWYMMSGTFAIVAIMAIFVFGAKLGFDFTGGTLLEFKFKEPITKQVLTEKLNEIEKESAAEVSIPKTPEAAVATESSTTDVTIKNEESEKLDFSKAQIIESGTNSYVVKTKYLSSEVHDKLIEKMKTRLPEFTEPRFTTIGPSIGSTLLHKAIIAMILAMAMIIIYVALAFRKVPKEVGAWKFGVTAIVSLVHDLLFVTGLFVILGQIFNVEIDALFITAMLTVFGYSVNDTIIIYDRLRENLIAKEKDETLEHTVNKALNETLTRSIYTTLTTVLPLFAILLFGSSSIFYFALALCIGTMVGAYSSMFVAAPILVSWTKYAEKAKK
ncbi:MAG: protein translocase subunit SecF [Candidatus Gracilibacteria bacterium]|jgi:SecD/SecF fusion protein